MWETVERYSFSGYLQSGPYLFQPLDLPVFHDIAYEGGNAIGDIWYACDDSDSPIKAFDTNGELTDYIWNTVVPAAHGLCFENSQYIWASNFYTDELYRIDLHPAGIETGVSITQSARTLTTETNPFYSSVTIRGTGFTDHAQLEIFDIYGRKLIGTEFNGSFTWNGTDQHGNQVPAGSYTAIVFNGESGSVSLRLLRL